MLSSSITSLSLGLIWTCIISGFHSDSCPLCGSLALVSKIDVGMIVLSPNLLLISSVAFISAFYLALGIEVFKDHLSSVCRFKFCDKNTGLGVGLSWGTAVIDWAY